MPRPRMLSYAWVVYRVIHLLIMHLQLRVDGVLHRGTVEHVLIPNRTVREQLVWLKVLPQLLRYVRRVPRD